MLKNLFYSYVYAQKLKKKNFYFFVQKTGEKNWKKKKIEIFLSYVHV